MIDVRTHNEYNQKYLSEYNSTLLKGYDMALKSILALFDNLEFYEGGFDFDDADINVLRYLQKPRHKEELDRFKEMISDWHEGARNTLVTSMLDGMDRDEYEKNKADVGSGRREPYFSEVRKERI